MSVSCLCPVQQTLLGLLTFLNQNFKPYATFVGDPLNQTFEGGGGTHKSSWVLLMTVGLFFKSRIWDPADYTKCCYSTHLISFFEHVEVIMGWLEEGTGRPEATLENKSKWNMCHLEICAVPTGDSRFLY